MTRSLIDELFYEVDGASSVAGDEATQRLDAVLAKIQKLSSSDRTKIFQQLQRLGEEAALDAAKAEKRRLLADAKVREWEARAASSTGELLAQATAQVTAARAQAEAMAEESAEYRVTVQRLAEVRALLSR